MSAERAESLVWGSNESGVERIRTARTVRSSRTRGAQNILYLRFAAKFPILSMVGAQLGCIPREMQDPYKFCRAVV